MIFKTLIRSGICFCAAIVLLALSVCALEFGCRIWSVTHSFNDTPGPLQLEEIVAPSATSWIEVRRLIDRKHLRSDGTVCELRTNEFGTRGASITVPKPRGTYRILCLGGNGVFGTDLPEDQTIPALLQKSLSGSGTPVEVINAGCPQAGPLGHVLRYRTSLSALQPDLIILCVSIDDLALDVDVRGALHLDASRQPAYAAHPVALHATRSPADGVRKEFLFASWTMDWAIRNFGAKAPANPVLVPQEGGYGRRELGPIVSLAQMVTADYGRLIVSTTPSAWGLEQTRSAISHQRPTFADDIRKTLLELQVSDLAPVHDMTADLCQMPDPRALFSSRYGCLTEAGNQLYAESLARSLSQLIPELHPTSRQAGQPASFEMRRTR